MQVFRSSTHPNACWSLLASVLLLGSGLVGCATGPSGNPFVESAARNVYQLRIESLNSYDVSIYLETGEGRSLLTTIRARSIEFLEFQYPLGRPLRLELESFMGERYRVPPGSAQGGGRIDLIIYEDIRRSRFIRR